jgi:hypothetical protein
MKACGGCRLGDLPLPTIAGNTKDYSALLPATDNDDKGDIRCDQHLIKNSPV